MAANRPQRARRAPSKLTEQAAVAGVPIQGRRTQKKTQLTTSSISSPLPQPEFDVEVDYKLIVNGKSAVHRAPERHDCFMWWLDDVEKVVNEMLEQPEARLNGRDYEIESRTVGFRAGIKTRKVLITLADFSQVGETKLYRAIDYQVSKTPGVRLVEVSVEVRVRSRALEKAFKRNQSFNEPSSDIDEAATLLPERNLRCQ
ncbi:hypothetical protein K469DRAFT_753843 [Zopfia rhizophila CBS 207.26]|uniref:Uncharacterized protein n=1 Tax=Zopfia rhizophila CBS 207.26 TaxID=1314779 RepID=A0A6A6DJ50_9PEZI|nr:hypothetical protein K469DRAFT_753843 [Zopfia rhizophila CBS 207.26]